MADVIAGPASAADRREHSVAGRIVFVLLARAGISAPPRAEMADLAAALAEQAGTPARYAFAEQGEPALRTVLLDLVANEVAEIVIVPLAIPAEASMANWLQRVTRRWQRESGKDWPPIRIGKGLSAERGTMLTLVSGLARAAAAEKPVVFMPEEKPEGTLVPAQKRRVLVCHGSPCNNAGASVIWGHLRNEQQRLNLRTEGDGVMSAKSSCLGPCALAPVMQVFPTGTYYGGVDEAGIDRVIAEDLIGGCVVEDLAYAATGKKQRLRAAEAQS